MTDDESGDTDVVNDAEYAPRIAVLGAGPIGLETALYARYLGYEVALLEKNTIAGNVLRWGHVNMFSPFSMNRSSLGVAAMQAHYEDLQWPADDAILSGREFTEIYLHPLANTDLLAGCIHEHVEVLGIARDGIIKTDAGDVARADYPFRVWVRSTDGEEFIEADFVIDTTGVLDQSNYFGHGGLPALGELEVDRAKIHRHVPDILGNARPSFENKRVLVVGSGYSAATSIVALVNLHQQAPQTEVTWVTRREAADTGPMPFQDQDPLVERHRLSNLANRMTRSPDSIVELADQTSILEMTPNVDGSLRVNLAGKVTGPRDFDVMIVNTGYRPDTSLFSELQVELCKMTEATRAMGDWLSGLGIIDALNLSLPGPEVLQTGEPNFFVLGSKSFGRNSNFLLSLGLRQIQQAFTVIADRQDLDLYETMAKLI
jgi:thioredoxin reductase